MRSCSSLGRAEKLNIVDFAFVRREVWCVGAAECRKEHVYEDGMYMY